MIINIWTTPLDMQAIIFGAYPKPG